MRFFSQLLESYFQQSAQRQGLLSHHFKIAGKAVSVKFSGRRWSKEMTGAIAHLERAHVSDSDLTISVWDGSLEPQNHLLRAYLFVLTNWWFHYTGPRGELLDIHSEKIAATYHPGTETLSVVDLDRGQAFYWKRNEAPIPYYETCSPFRSLLHSWMRSQDRFFVHGAAVGFPGGGVLLVGKGGSGKSTSALACLESGLRYAGDDYCIVQQDNSGVYGIHSLYCTAKLVGINDLESFPDMTRSVLNLQRFAGEKVAISIHDYSAAMLIEGFPLRAILVPVITHETETRMVPCSPREAMMAIAPSTLSQLPASGKRDLEFLGHLARRVPCYRMEAGTALRRIPEKISELLATRTVPA